MVSLAGCGRKKKKKSLLIFKNLMQDFQWKIEPITELISDKRGHSYFTSVPFFAGVYKTNPFKICLSTATSIIPQCVYRTEPFTLIQTKDHTQHNKHAQTIFFGFLGTSYPDIGCRGWWWGGHQEGWPLGFPTTNRKSEGLVSVLSKLQILLFSGFQGSLQVSSNTSYILL